MRILKRKTIYIFQTLMILFICIMTGCGSSSDSGKTGNISIDAPAICQEIIDSGAFSETLNEVDNSYSDLVIGIGSDSFTSAVIYTGSGATAEELSIIQVAEEKNTDYIAAKLNTHISNQADAYAGYKPEEVDKINSAIIKKKGSYVILCVANDKSTAEEIINKYFE